MVDNLILFLLKFRLVSGHEAGIRPTQPAVVHIRGLGLNWEPLDGASSCCEFQAQELGSSPRWLPDDCPLLWYRWILTGQCSPQCPLLHLSMESSGLPAVARFDPLLPCSESWLREKALPASSFFSEVFLSHFRSFLGSGDLIPSFSSSHCYIAVLYSLNFFFLSLSLISSQKSLLKPSLSTKEKKDPELEQQQQQQGTASVINNSIVHVSLNPYCCNLHRVLQESIKCLYFIDEKIAHFSLHHSDSRQGNWGRQQDIEKFTVHIPGVNT